ncbi:hypothetical protein LCGC14_1910790, partial [marine sediment metagenome]
MPCLFRVTRHDNCLDYYRSSFVGPVDIPCAQSTVDDRECIRAAALDYPRGELVNRRGFFGAIGAAVGAIALPVGYISWLQWKLKSYLYVVPMQRQAEALYNAMGRPKNVKVINTGAMICGYGFDLIIMDENWRDWDYGSNTRKQHLTNWYNNTIRTRL